jgi:signal transduction histidine kinase
MKSRTDAGVLELDKIADAGAGSREELTKRKDSEATTEAEPLRLNEALDTLPAYVVLLSADYHVPYANRFFRERFGESHGRRCFEYLFGRNEPCENCETYKVFKTNAPHHWEWLGPDGRNYDIFDFPFTDADGSPLILETGIDITEHKRAEAELKRHREHLEELVRERTCDLEAANVRLRAEVTERERLERLYAVLSRVNEAIVRTHDEQALYLEVCRAVVEEGRFPLAWIGLVKGREVTPVAWSGPAAEYLAEIKVEVEGDLGAGPTGTCVREDRAVVNDDFTTNITTAPWRKPALDRGFRASAAFPLHRQGKVIGALALYAPETGVFNAEQVKLLAALSADVSYALGAMELERLRTEGEQMLRVSERTLREADRRKNEFLAMLSHELRNPLAPIRNSLYILDRVAPGSASARQAQEVMSRQLGQLTRLVDDLLDITRITSGKIQLQRERLELGEVVGRTVEDHRSLFIESGVELVTDPGPGDMWIRGDRTRLAQVVGNLLQNAAKFTPGGGKTTVRVGTDDSGAQATVQVCDTGAGIGREILPRVFEPFIQAEATLGRSRGGLGLGLALVKGLVDMHGGSVNATSEGPGRGAEFTISLPLERRTHGSD